MQRELSASCDPDSCGPQLPQHAIQILGVNRVGSESGNTTISTGRILPWLQDTAAAQVWYAWHADTDEIFILDTENRSYATFSVGAYPLDTPANYDALKSLLLQAAHRPVP